MRPCIYFHHLFLEFQNLVFFTCTHLSFCVLPEGQEKAVKSDCESEMEAEKRLSQAMMSVTSPLSPSHTFLGLNANAFTIRCVSTGLLRQKKFLFFHSIISFNSDCSDCIALMHLSLKNLEIIDICISF